MHKDLNSIDKVLFIVHLAIGDYTYMQNCFKKLKENFPHLQIDLFIQESRRTDDESKWSILDNYILYEWLESSQLFGQIYKTYSSKLLSFSTEEAKNKHYPLVISLGDLRSQNYSSLARQIAQDKFAIGIDIETTIFHRSHRKDLNLLDLKIKDFKDKSHHISQKFAYWFTQIMGLKFTQDDLYPKIQIPLDCQVRIENKLTHWKKNLITPPSVFINIYAKGEERCLQPIQAIQLIEALQSQSYYKNALFILNSPPEATNELQDYIHKYNLQNTVTFCATESFFELPALLTQCDLIITVDTSIMHLACISNAYLISLIRKKAKKDVRWTPLKENNNVVIYTSKSSDPMSSIKVESILSHVPYYQP